MKYIFAHQKNIYICKVKISYFLLQKYNSIGEMAEWSIVAVSKTVVPSGTGGSNPPLSAELIVQQADNSHKLLNLWEFFYPLVSALKYTFSPPKDKVRNLTRTPDKQKRKGGTDCPKLAKSCRYLACLHRTHF